MANRGERIRTSDLLNPIQEEQESNPIPHQQLTPTPIPVCTPVCTSDAKNDVSGPNLDALADVLRSLPDAKRAKLFAMLLASKSTEGK